MKNKSLYLRLQFAINGLFLAFKSEKSFRFQLLVSIIVLGLLGIMQPPLIWWAIIFLMIGLVLTAELINTAFEALCDLVHPDYSEQIKQIKDISAGAVLVVSLCSVCVGLFFLFDNLL